MIKTERPGCAERENHRHLVLKIILWDKKEWSKETIIASEWMKPSQKGTDASQNRRSSTLINTKEGQHHENLFFLWPGGL
ncbi:hypothetical protein MTBBW1_1800006 [Desulfamplus magnetovallimortis]|uniref:Uncharacterized protein n=1 Tax=Desulfamplus magnetovallimortis TaxID=1246637 RepID=A0A1W1HAT0_9BACT|nr:hypothetical protein MTBBW1_1800006 [Desulfamplus magnetovallimortis]